MYVFPHTGTSNAEWSHCPLTQAKNGILSPHVIDLPGILSAVMSFHIVFTFPIFQIISLWGKNDVVTTMETAFKSGAPVCQVNLVLSLSFYPSFQSLPA